MNDEIRKGIVYVAWEKESRNSCHSGKLRVLIVDDSEIFTRRIAHAVNQMGYEVVGTCRDGEEGQRTIELLQPDVVIIDNEMPVAKGCECIRNLQEKGISTRYVLISATIDNMVLSEYISLDVDAILCKPVNFDALALILEHFAEECLRCSAGQSK